MGLFYQSMSATQCNQVMKQVNTMHTVLEVDAWCASIMTLVFIVVVLNCPPLGWRREMVGAGC